MISLHSNPGERPHVVVLGAGFGGLAVARALTGKDVDVTIVDKRNHHTFQPLLYQVATAGLDSNDVASSVRGIFHRASNISVRQGEVIGIDFESQTIRIRDGEHLAYDYVVLALGAVTADFGVPGVDDFAFGLKDVAEASSIRDHILTNFELATRVDGDSTKTTVVVVGGGPTGVEMAGGLAELIDRVLVHDFPELDRSDMAVVLVEAGENVLGGFQDRLRNTATSTLRKMGVDVRLNLGVAEVDARGVLLSNGERIDSETVIWAAGVRAHPLVEVLELETERGRVSIDAHLRATGQPRVFAIGDLAATPDGEGGLVAQVAAVAVQGGEHVAKTILAENGLGELPKPFRYLDRGSMATIGRNAAVVEFPNGWTIRGFPGWVAWLGLHLTHLIGVRNRASVFVNWAWNYLTYDRGSRAVVTGLEHREIADERDKRSELSSKLGEERPSESGATP